MPTYRQAGWWIPGKLEAGWSSDLQANYNDMLSKFNQLELTPIVQGPPPFQGLGLYYSQGDWDFIQLLTSEDPDHAQTIVTYSIWLSNQGWASTSPVSIAVAEGHDEALGVDIPAAAADGGFGIAGWYLVGSLESAWYADVEGNLVAAAQQRRALGLRDCSPLYVTQNASSSTVQMIQAPWRDGRQDFDPVQQYANWWGQQGFGSQRAVPFMTPTLLGNALLKAGETP